MNKIVVNDNGDIYGLTKKRFDKLIGNCGDGYNFENGKDELVFDYFWNTINKTQAMFKYENLPETIPQVELEKILQLGGYVCIAKKDDKLWAVSGGLCGTEESPYYIPTKIIVSNPALKWFDTLKDEEDCVIIRNTTTWMPLTNMIMRYCSHLADTDISIHVANVNSRLMTLMVGSTDNDAKSLDKMIDNIKMGKLGSTVGSSMMEAIKTLPYSTSQSNSVIKNLIELMQYMKASLLQDIGVNANYNMKRESINESEAGLNDDALLPLCDDMLNERRKGIDKVNKLFGTDISVDFSSTWRDLHEQTKHTEEGEDNESETDSEELSE